MPPLTDSIPAQTTAFPLFWNAGKSWNVAENDFLFFRKENYTASQAVAFDGTPTAHTLGSESWVAALLLVQFFVYSFSLARFGKVWLGRLLNVWRKKEYSGLFVNEAEKGAQESFLYLMLTAVNAGIFLRIAVCGDVLCGAWTGFVSVSLFVALTAAVLLLRYALTLLVGKVFFPPDQVAYVRSEVLAMFSFLGFALFLILLLMIYGNLSAPLLVWTGLSAFAFYLTVKLYKILSVFYADVSSFSYLFLYLCALEILPIVSLYLGLLAIAKN